MRMREYRAEDAGEVAAIHEAMGFDYRMIDLDAGSIQFRTVCEDERGILAAAALRNEPETYLWVRPDAAPQAKWLAIRMVQRQLVKYAVRAGIEQIVAYVPTRRFLKRMLTLGWEKPRDGWTPMLCEVRRAGSGQPG